MDFFSGELLERLAALVTCDYLSDLRCQPAPVLLQALRDTPEEDFSPEQWREAASYLTGQPMPEDGKGCRSLLLDYYAKGEGKNLPCP